MVEFILSQKEKKESEMDVLEWYNYVRIMNGYANFLNQPLALGMFVPCDEEGNMLEKPECTCDVNKKTCKLNEYQEAKEKVLFKGVTYDNVDSQFNVRFYFVSDCQVLNIQPDGSRIYWHHDNIEGLLRDTSKGITLTKTAIKEIGL